MSMERNLRRIVISLGCSPLLINPALDVLSFTASKSKAYPPLGTGEEHHLQFEKP